MAVSPEMKNLFDTLSPQLSGMKLEEFAAINSEATKYKQYEPVKTPYEEFQFLRETQIDPNVKTLREKKAKLAELKKLRHAPPAIGAEIKSLEKELQELESGINDISKSVAAAFGEIDPALKQYKLAAFDQLEKRFTDAESARRAAESALQAKAAELEEARKSQQVAPTSEDTAKIASLQSEYNTLYSEVGSLKEQLVNLKVALDKSNEEKKALEERLDTTVECLNPEEHGKPSGDEKKKPEENKPPVIPPETQQPREKETLRERFTNTGIGVGWLVAVALLFLLGGAIVGAGIGYGWGYHNGVSSSDDLPIPPMVVADASSSNQRCFSLVDTNVSGGSVKAIVLPTFNMDDPIWTVCGHQGDLAQAIAGTNPADSPVKPIGCMLKEHAAK